MDQVKVCIDIGNTSSKAGIFDDEGHLYEYIKPFTAEHFKLIRDKAVSILVSKTGSNAALEALLKDDDYLRPNTPLPIGLDYHTPETLGADRIAAAVGAHAIDQHADWLVIDIGTCLTLDFINDKTFHGGMISPGIPMRFAAMNQLTASLPLVSFDNTVQFPGKTTHESMQVGAYQSMKYEILGYINHLNAQHKNLKVVFCSDHIMDFDKVIKNQIFARPNLVLEGLHFILQQNA